ncbi:hypothetical protein CJA_2177 [Cellvibrio japonicus Ueda107]|uniref:Uncharacterized protein n=1 Tax=Cellvibrio japonicus (strain Ueda107) TaxID=498211 RepID=B3PJ67_CELJU|nr:hypothetical protein CJA_2177 [Cellvibrio japonicus Ueda107]
MARLNNNEYILSLDYQLAVLMEGMVYASADADTGPTGGGRF